tara:strand:- start:707 stop:1045 length:339 start_codon:yes stop_codon:yes gene_type:complete
MKSKYSRKQMTPGMKKCKDMYGKKMPRSSSPFTKTKSPYETNQALIQGASDIASQDIDTATGTATGLETVADLLNKESKTQQKKYGVPPDEVVDAFSGQHTTDKQIQDNLSV